MAFGFMFYFGSYTISYDLDEGLSLRSSDSEPRMRSANSLVASEAKIRTYLTDHGVDNIKSIKFVEPKWPKNDAAKRCNDMLRLFAQDLAEAPRIAEFYCERLKNYCGVDIQY